MTDPYKEEVERLAAEEAEAVAAAEKKEAAARGKRSRGPDPEIDSKFILQCLFENELGDGNLYKALYRNSFVFDNSRDLWLAQMFSHLTVDKMKQALMSVDGVAKAYSDEAKRTAEQIKEISAKGDDPGYLEARLKKLRKRVEDLRGVRRRENCLKFARTSENPLAIEGNEIDQKPWLLPCANGVINLKTGELEPPRPSDYLEKHSPIAWPEKGLGAKCPLWEKTLLEIFSGNADLVAYLRRLLGYSLIGAVLLAVFVVLVGRGRNGKSLIVYILSKIMGALSGVIRPEMLLESSGSGNPAGPTPHIMTLRGLRMAFASETDDGCKISPSRVKWLTGNDTLTGRNPHDKYEVQFSPSHTLILLTNHKPHAPADDFAFWERMNVIPFEVSFVNRPPKADYERQADPNLAEKLEQELPAILAWMVRGCLEFQQIGLDPPPAVIQAVQEYQRDEDLLADFLEGYCIIGGQYSVEFSDIYPVFETWWSDNVGTRVPSRIKFAKLLTKKGFEKTRGRTSRYYGLALLAENGIFENQ